MGQKPTDTFDWFEETLWPDWAQRLRVKEVLFRDKTQHQDLIVFESFAWGRVLALDGVVQTTTADEYVYHEMLVHVPIRAHGRAQDVLIIGGGDGGCLREALRHGSVRRATLVEIDRGVIDFCRRYLPSLSAGAFEHPKARIVIADGARYVHETDDRYDVLIVDSTDPQGPGAALFTEAFYRDCRRLLRPGGVMTTQCGNPAIYPDELAFTQERQRAAGYAQVTYYFAAVPTYIGGNMALGFATDDPATFQEGTSGLSGPRPPQGLRYYTPAVHAAAFAHPAWMMERVGYSARAPRTGSRGARSRPRVKKPAEAVAESAFLPSNPVALNVNERSSAPGGQDPGSRDGENRDRGPTARDEHVDPRSGDVAAVRRSGRLARAAPG